jgi:ribosomal 30S subunit maturation factor RimM
VGSCQVRSKKSSQVRRQKGKIVEEGCRGEMQVYSSTNSQARDADSKNNLEPQPQVEDGTRNEMKNVCTWGIRDNGKGNEVGAASVVSVLAGTRGEEGL